MQGWPSPRSGEDPAAPTLGQVAPAKACGAGGKDRTGVGRGLLVGTEGGTWEARLWPPGPEHTLALPPPTAALPRASVSLSAEAPCRRGVWRGARLRVPTPTLRSSQPAAPLSQTNRGGDKVAPTRICHSSRRRPQSSPDDALGHWLGGTETTERGRREAPPPIRQRVPGQCAPRSLQAALGETLVCRAACREEGTEGGLCAPRLVRLGPGSPHL